MTSNGIHVFFEWMNAYLFILDLVAMSIIGAFVAPRLREEWRQPHVDAAIAILVYVFGHFMARSWTWAWLHRDIGGLDLNFMHNLPLMPMSMGMTIVGLICVTRIFASAWLGWKWWIALVLGAAALATLITWY